jgi:hypothetical protein
MSDAMERLANFRQKSSGNEVLVEKNREERIGSRLKFVIEEFLMPPSRKPSPKPNSASAHSVTTRKLHHRLCSTVKIKA